VRASGVNGCAPGVPRQRGFTIGEPVRNAVRA